MRGRREIARPPSVEAEDANEPIGETRVVQYLTEEHKSRFKYFDLTTKPTIIENTVEEEGGDP